MALSTSRRRPPFPLPATRPPATDTEAAKTGSLANREAWLRAAYRQAVNADTWHLGDPMDAGTRNAVFAGVAGPVPPYYQGADGEYYFHNARTFEDADTRGHRARFFAGKTMDQIAAARMPGEDEYVAARLGEPTRSAANRNLPRKGGLSLTGHSLINEPQGREKMRIMSKSSLIGTSPVTGSTVARRRAGDDAAHNAVEWGGYFGTNEDSDASSETSLRLPAGAEVALPVTGESDTKEIEGFVHKRHAATDSAGVVAISNANKKRLCIEACTRLALPTGDFGIKFQRCMNQCMGLNEYPEWKDAF